MSLAGAGGYDPGHCCLRVLGGIMRRIAVLFAVCLLAVAGCSSGGEPERETVTVTATPSLSEAEARAACVDAWLAVLEETPDVAPDVADKPAVCEGLAGQAAMYAEALVERNEANRERYDECTRNPACTDFPAS